MVCVCVCSGQLRYEAGVHRATSVPFNSTKMQTSTASVVVLPEATEVISGGEGRLLQWINDCSAAVGSPQSDSAGPARGAWGCQDALKQHKAQQHIEHVSIAWP
jgi:hypothetical protein